jgi:hypothetical protein
MLKSALALLAVSGLVVGAFPLAEAIRLHLMKKAFPFPPKWKASIQVGLGVLVINLIYSLVWSPWAPETNASSVDLLVALAAHYGMSFFIWLFLVWAWHYWWNRTDGGKR